MNKTIGLKLSELIEGNFYQCRLSGKTMIATGGVLILDATYFNDVSGLYETTMISDYQLIEIEPIGNYFDYEPEDKEAIKKRWEEKYGLKTDR